MKIKRKFSLTALHHLGEGLHCSLLGALIAALRQERAHYHLKGAATRQVVVLRWTSGCLVRARTLERGGGKNCCQFSFNIIIISLHI